MVKIRMGLILRWESAQPVQKAVNGVKLIFIGNSETNGTTFLFS